MKFKRISAVFAASIVMALLFTSEALANAPTPGGYSWQSVFSMVVFAIIIPFAITVCIEILVALAFKLGKYHAVFLVNLVSNPLMNLLLVCTYVFLLGSGMETGLILALSVFVAEAVFITLELIVYFAVYKKKFGRKKILIYTLTANIASCLAGLAYGWLVVF